jgi:hypothetical protein
MNECLNDEEIEQVRCGVKTSDELILAGCIYRPPGQPHMDSKIINSIKRSYELINKFKFNGVLICGDFNCPKIEWNSGSFATTSSDSFEYLLLDALFLFVARREFLLPKRDLSDFSRHKWGCQKLT